MSYALSKSTYRRRRRVASEFRVLLRRLRGLKLAEERERARAGRASSVVETDWIKADEAATILGVTRGYLRHMKDVPSHGKGRQRRWKRSELEEHLAARGRAA